MLLLIDIVHFNNFIFYLPLWKCQMEMFINEDVFFKHISDLMSFMLITTFPVCFNMAMAQIMLACDLIRLQLHFETQRNLSIIFVIINTNNTHMHTRTRTY